MIAKFFEVRDRSTLIPIIAFRLLPENSAERYLCGRAGYRLAESYVMVCKIDGDELSITYDPEDWGDRTMRVAHKHLLKCFDGLESGSVLDVEYILGERLEPRQSDAEEVAEQGDRS